jgi:F-type H+-transporting ATPase subunit b
VLGGLAMAVVLGVGLPLRTTRAQEAAASKQEPAGAASAPEAQSPAKNQQAQDEDDQYRKSPSVVAIGAKLGLNPEQSAMAFEISNFVLLAVGIIWVLMKIGLPFMQLDPMPKIIRDRNATIQKDLVDARTATEEARARLSGVEERLGKLDDEIAAMRALAEQDSAKAEQRIKATVEDEKGKILTAAEQEITAATSHAQKQLQQYAAGLAIEQAARKLVVSAETDRLLVQDFAQRLTGDEPKKGQN